MKPKTARAASRKRRRTIERRFVLVDTRLVARCFALDADLDAGTVNVLHPTAGHVATIDLVALRVTHATDLYRLGVERVVELVRRTEARS